MQREFIERVVQALEHLGVSYAITDSIASNYWSGPRFTHDLDILVALDVELARRVAAAFPESFYVSEQAAVEAARTHRMFNVIDTCGTMKADLWVSPNDEFNASVLARRRHVEILKGVQADVASPEDVILSKLAWNQITTSERQLADAAGIAAVQAGNLDLAYLRDWAARQGTSAVLEEVLQGKYLNNT